ncbi:MAG: T9SS type A sorting domain-containing protein, partial [Bacteroidales bacterium]|nr:T9SS type A sorting domain-containing protein [Bacteroidales bacterium]
KPELIIHPNPANDRIEIEIINSSSGIHEIIIYDVYGKIVLQKNINAKDFLLLDITELSKGFYFITYELDDKQIIIKKLSKV